METYVKVPQSDLNKLEEARIELLKTLEPNVNLGFLTRISNPMWVLTHTKYPQIKKKKNDLKIFNYTR